MAARQKFSLSDAYKLDTISQQSAKDRIESTTENQANRMWIRLESILFMTNKRTSDRYSIATRTSSRLGRRWTSCLLSVSQFPGFQNGIGRPRFQHFASLDKNWNTLNFSSIHSRTPVGVQNDSSQLINKFAVIERRGCSEFLQLRIDYQCSTYQALPSKNLRENIACAKPDDPCFENATLEYERGRIVLSSPKLKGVLNHRRPPPPPNPTIADHEFPARDFQTTRRPSKAFRRNAIRLTSARWFRRRGRSRCSSVSSSMRI